MPIFMGQREGGRPVYADIAAHGMKFVLFRERDAHAEWTGGGDYGSKVETTFRFGLKGGLHFLGSEESPIRISRLHFDGHEHLGRHIDRQRIVDRIQGLREYCTFARRVDLIDDRKSNHEAPGSQSYMDCQFLQLVDILIGGFRTALGYTTREIHKELARPILTRVKEYERGFARMRNSRWRDSFVMSQCYLENGKWLFEGVRRKRDGGTQLKLC